MARTPIRHNPVVHRGLGTLWNDPFRQAEDLLSGFFIRPIALDSLPETPVRMKVDVSEDGDRYLIHAELPGVKKEDINVEVDGSTVSISAEVKQNREDKEGEKVLRVERYFGQVSRSFQLAGEIDEAKAVADYKDGILELTLPKKVAQSRSKKLTIG